MYKATTPIAQLTTSLPFSFPPFLIPSLSPFLHPSIHQSTTRTTTTSPPINYNITNNHNTNNSNNYLPLLLSQFIHFFYPSIKINTRTTTTCTIYHNTNNLTPSVFILPSINEKNHNYNNNSNNQNTNTTNNNNHNNLCTTIHSSNRPSINPAIHQQQLQEPSIFFLDVSRPFNQQFIYPNPFVHSSIPLLFFFRSFILPSNV